MVYTYEEDHFITFAVHYDFPSKTDLQLSFGDINYNTLLNYGDIKSIPSYWRTAKCFYVTVYVCLYSIDFFHKIVKASLQCIQKYCNMSSLLCFWINYQQKIISMLECTITNSE